MNVWRLRVKRYRSFPPALATLSLLLAAAVPQSAAQPAPRLSLLTTAREAHGLTRKNAARAYPVHVRGVVTFYDPYQDDGSHPSLFIKDATAGIFVKLAPHSMFPMRPGSIVDVSGVTDPGGYGPILIESALRVVQPSGPLPGAPQATLPHLLTGAEDSQWVEVEGIVHSVEIYGQHVNLTLAMKDGPLVATTVKEEGGDYASLVDSKVLIRAVAGPLVDNKGQMTGVRLLWPGLTTLAVEQRGPADPFDLPVRPLDTLLQYSPSIDLQHRVHARGRVTLYWPGRTLCIEDGKDGLCVQTRDHPDLANGESVDVVGFPSVEDSEPTLSDATVRGTGNVVPQLASRITPTVALTGEHEAELVEIEGRLIGRSLVMTDSALLLSSGQTVFPVILPPSSGPEEGKKWPAWVDGSRLLVTGVLSGKVDTRLSTKREGISRLQSFQVLLRTPDDAMVLETPSWWTAGRTLTILTVVGSLTVIVIVWVILLRRQVEQQTLIIRRSEERFRHLAEHDSLTGLASRASLYEHLNLAIENAQTLATPLAVLMMDLDRFKQINDTLGHAAGDEVLSTVAKRLQSSLRTSDTLSRMGGDEFVALLEGVQDAYELARIAAKIVATVAVAIRIDGRDVPVSVSLGISTFPGGGENAVSLLHSADMAMYRAKTLGRNSYQFFDPEMALAGGDNPVRQAELAASILIANANCATSPSVQSVQSVPSGQKR